jgi:hypothetical protein
MAAGKLERSLPGDARPEVLTDTLVWVTSPSTEAPCVIDLGRPFVEVLGEPCRGRGPCSLGGRAPAGVDRSRRVRKRRWVAMLI